MYFSHRTRLCSAILLATIVSLTVIEAALAAESLEAVGNLGSESSKHSAERREIEKLLNQIESEWNAHNLEAVMTHYADDYVNNDGLNKESVEKLTKDFWATYPNARSTSITREIRIEGPFVTVESKDRASGTTVKEMPGIGTKGELSSIAEGQLYMKKIGNHWRIIGDRIDYEKVRVAFGLARELQAEFSAPEQVQTGSEYSARLDLELPAGLTAVCSITNQPLEYPQHQPDDKWRPMDGSTLERLMAPNTGNRNELLMATVGVTNAARNSLMGLAFLTRRINVIPKMYSSSPAKEQSGESEESAEGDQDGDKE